MEVGFAVLLRAEQMEVHFLGRRPEDPRSLVGHAWQGRLHAVLMGRLTYQQELLKQLPPETGANLTEGATLALAAYRSWGPMGLARLEGCFALVIWDGDKQLLLGSRDALGGYPLFWTKHADSVAFATCQRSLLPLLPRRSLNLEYLAEFLALPGPVFQEPATRQCVYEGIHRVGPGSIVQTRLWDGRVHEENYWNWLDRMVDPGTDRLEELGELVRNGLRRAVGEQLRGRVACHVSGGMDSTAVALLARDALRGAPGQPPVHAISAVFDKLGGLSHETSYLECALEQPGLVPHRVPADDILDYDRFTNPPVHDEPLTELDRFSLLATLVEVAAQAGADTLLTGGGADGLMDQLPYPLADLLARGRLWSAWRKAAAWGRSGNRSAWRCLWSFGVLPWLPAAWRAGLGPLWRGGHAEWHRQGPGTIPPWVRPDFARAHALRERALHALKPPCRSRHMAEILATLPACVGDCTRWYSAAPLGIAYVHPFLDARFICLCLGIQLRFRQEPGPQKPLLNCAMRDVLPESIRNRRSKGHYNALLHSGLTRNLPALEALIRQTPVAGVGAFDMDVLLDCLQQAALGHVPGVAMDKLKLTLAWLRWYSLQDEWQKPMTPAAVRRAPVVAGAAAHSCCGSAA